MGFSDEAIRMLLTEVENNRTDILVILAGYDDKMSTLMKADPGLARRFPNKLVLPDYDAKDLASIARLTAEEKFGVKFEMGLEDLLSSELDSKLISLESSKHNGGLAVRLVEAAIGQMAERLVSTGDVEKGVHSLQLQDFNI